VIDGCLCDPLAQAKLFLLGLALKLSPDPLKATGKPVDRIECALSGTNGTGIFINGFGLENTP